jgi:hypothetical protein
MKSSGRKSLHKLIIDDKFDHQFFGIVTHEPDYKTSLELNKKLNISLKNDMPAILGDENEIAYSRFTAKSKYSDLSYQLVSNKSDSSSLSKNFPALDYLFVICGSLTDEIVEEAKLSIRDIKEVTAVFILDKEQLSDEYLILQIS